MLVYKQPQHIWAKEFTYHGVDGFKVAVLAACQIKSKKSIIKVASSMVTMVRVHSPLTTDYLFYFSCRRLVFTTTNQLTKRKYHDLRFTLQREKIIKSKFSKQELYVQTL